MMLAFFWRKGGDPGWQVWTGTSLKEKSVEFKKSVEKNPLTYIATCVIAAATLTAGVMQHFSSQELVLLKERNQSNIDDLNSKLASFRRGIPGSEFFDIRTLLYSRSSPDGGANPPRP